MKTWTFTAQEANALANLYDGCESEEDCDLLADSAAFRGIAVQNDDGFPVLTLYGEYAASALLEAEGDASVFLRSEEELDCTGF